MKKFTGFLQMSFIALNAVSGIYYIYMGQWKARVSLFGMVSLLLVFIMTADFILFVIHFMYAKMSCYRMKKTYLYQQPY